MESVELPNSLVHIGERVFYGCRNLSEVSLPDNIRTMEKDVFKTCRRLTKIDLPANLDTIHEGAFRKCGITSLVIPGKVSRIDREAFGSCRQLKHVHLPKNIPEIADDAFGFIRPKALDKVTIEASPITYPPEILNNRLRTRIESQLSIKRRIEQRRSREEKALSMLDVEIEDKAVEDLSFNTTTQIAPLFPRPSPLEPNGLFLDDFRYHAD